MEKIITQQQYTNALLDIEELLDQVDESAPKDDPLMSRLIAASDIVEAYEQQHYTIGMPSLVDVIRLRMQELKIKNKDLAKLIDTAPPRVSEYLNGKRDITLEVARKLHKRLNIDSDIILNG